MTVDISLCGSIPRSEMMACSSHRSRLNLPKQQSPAITLATDDVIAMAASSLARKVSDDHVVSSSQVIEPPSWAVPARGEATLEPVSDTRQFHKPVDLTRQAVFCVGRSDASDMQLLHCASSRRHAILFHHPNGSCYVVDCGSAHGTFINGIRVKSSITSNGVVPQKVKKGALIRFGGAGAPSFILKSFSVGLDSLIQNLKGNKTVTRRMNIVEDEPPTSLLQKHSTYSLDALVTLNTRLNSVGSVSTMLPSKNIASLAVAKLYSHCNPVTTGTSLKKRSMVSFDEESGEDEPANKKLKISIDSSSSDSDDSIAIVSPSRQKPVLVFEFCRDDRPVVSPNPFEDSSRTMSLAKGIAGGILTAPLSLPSTIKTKAKTVNFSVDPAEIFYAPSVTPESTSDNEGT
eukprot:scaffold10170_cov277-Chaetoceros_neogracile.AAC.12